MSFTIDGKQFAADRVNQTVQSGTIEEWTITNSSPMDHPIHLMYDRSKSSRNRKWSQPG
jgi:FtsP/CotA-like multicopper oxidase with cupredoxin domain